MGYRRPVASFCSSPNAHRVGAPWRAWRRMTGRLCWRIATRPPWSCCAATRPAGMDDTGDMPLLDRLSRLVAPGRAHPHSLSMARAKLISSRQQTRKNAGGCRQRWRRHINACPVFRAASDYSRIRRKVCRWPRLFPAWIKWADTPECPVVTPPCPLLTGTPRAAKRRVAAS
jgi:hypothetical protein